MGVVRIGTFLAGAFFAGAGAMALGESLNAPPTKVAAAFDGGKVVAIATRGRVDVMVELYPKKGVGRERALEMGREAALALLEGEAKASPSPITLPPELVDSFAVERREGALPYAAGEAIMALLAIATGLLLLWASSERG